MRQPQGGERLIDGLIEKEWRQHRGLILMIPVLLTSGFVLLGSLEAISSLGGSSLAILSWTLFLFLPLACLVLANALVASEFRQRTQIFLEGLPLPRWHLIGVKYGFGWLITTAAATLLLIIARWVAGGSEAMTMRFAALLWSKSLGWAWFCWAAVFAHAFLGRYRILIGLAVVIGLMWVEKESGVPINRFGPFELIGDRFAFERYEIPWTEGCITLAMILVLTVLGFALGSVRDATLASLLSETMSAREKIVLTALAIFFLMLIGSNVEREYKTDPLHLPGAVDIAQNAATISAAAAVQEPTHEENEAIRLHSQSIAECLSSAATFLRIAKLPTLFMVHRRDMKPEEFDDGNLDSRQGYLIRFNMLDTPPESEILRSHILKKVLDVHQHYRLDTDERGWVLEGFASWWPLRDRQSTPTDVIRSRQLELACSGLRIDEADITGWLRFKENLEDERVASTVAAVGLMVLGQMGEESRRTFLGNVLGYNAPHDFRAWLHDTWFSVPTLLQRDLRLNSFQLAKYWTTALQLGALQSGALQSGTPTPP